MKKVLLDWFWNSGVSDGLTYIAIPNAPTFADPVTISAADYDAGTGIVSGTLAGKLDVILSGALPDGTQWNGVTEGTADRFIRVTNEDENVTIGTALLDTRAAISQVNSSNYIEFFGKSQAAPLVLTTGALSGIGWTSQEIRTTNVFVNGAGFAGYQSNPSTGTYERLSIRFFRVLNTSAGEGIYIGNTSDTFGVFSKVIVLHGHIMNTNWDAMQIGHSSSVRMYNMTFRNAGLENVAAQNHLMQFVDDVAVVENCMFDTAPKLSNLFTHNITFKNCHFRITAGVDTAVGLIGRTDDRTWYPTARTNGGLILFDSCTFEIVGGTSDYLMDARERIADVEFRDCGFSGINTGIYLDARAPGETNDLIGTLSTNGNYTDTFPTPAYDSQGRITTPYFYNRGIGYLTPPPSLIVVDVRNPQNLGSFANGTAFGSLGLPAEVLFLKNDGLEISLAVTWDNTDYNATTPGTQTISGTITSLPVGLSNTEYAVETTINVTVLAAIDPANDLRVLVNVGGTSAPYVQSPDADSLYWNNLFQTLTTGVVAPLGNDAGDTFASLRNANGGLTGYQINATSTIAGAVDGENTGSPTAYPIDAIRGYWNHPSTTGTRSFKFTGLSTNAYVVKILCSRNDSFGGTFAYDITVTGSSGGGTINILTADVSGNIMTTKTFASVVPNAGEVIIGLVAGTGVELVNVVELTEIIP